MISPNIISIPNIKIHSCPYGFNRKCNSRKVDWFGDSQTKVCSVLRFCTRALPGVPPRTTFLITTNCRLLIWPLYCVRLAPQSPCNSKEDSFNIIQRYLISAIVINIWTVSDIHWADGDLLTKQNNMMVMLIMGIFVKYNDEH